MVIETYQQVLVTEAPIILSGKLDIVFCMCIQFQFLVDPKFSQVENSGILLLLHMLMSEFVVFTIMFDTQIYSIV